MEFLDIEAGCSDSDGSSVSDISSNLSGFIVRDSSGEDSEPGLHSQHSAIQERVRSPPKKCVRPALSESDEESGDGASERENQVDKRSRSRAFCFTWNNYPPNAEETLRGAFERRAFRYCLCGREKAPETGTPHLQGVIYFDNARTFTGCRSFFERLGGNGVHIERMHGTLEQSIAYCSKEGDYFSFGKAPKDAGARNLAGKREKERWAAIRAACEAQQYDELPDDFVCRYPGNPFRIFWLSQLTKKPVVRDELKNYWIWGESGTGKSRSVRTWAAEKQLSIYHKDRTKWWDLYSGEDVVLIEEFGPEEAKALGQYLKQWTDHYPFPAEGKSASSRLVRPPIVIVTSNFMIEELFPLSRDYEPLLRRFVVFYFSKDKENIFNV